MILCKTLWDRVSTISSTGTSGYFTEDDFNSNLYSVQYQVLSLLADDYENNQKISDFLINHIQEDAQTSLANGKLYSGSIISSLPNYYRSLSLQYIAPNNKVYPSKKITVSEVGMYESSPVRKPNLDKNRTLYYFVGNNITVLPKQADLDFNLIYLIKPALAKIAFTTASTDDNDYLVVDNANTIDIDFPEGLINLFTFLMLECMGIEQKENLLVEYSQLGLNRVIQTDIKN